MLKQHEDTMRALHVDSIDFNLRYSFVLILRGSPFLTTRQLTRTRRGLISPAKRKRCLSLELEEIHFPLCFIISYLNLQVQFGDQAKSAESELPSKHLDTSSMAVRKRESAVTFDDDDLLSALVSLAQMQQYKKCNQSDQHN